MALTFKRDMPGSYLSLDGRFRIYRDCECGHCAPWVVVESDENGYEIEHYGAQPTLAEAKKFAEFLRKDGGDAS